MIGAKDLAFPRLNLLSWYLYMLGGTITIYALLAGGVDTGWTFYAPYSTTFPIHTWWQQELASLSVASPRF